MLELLLEFQWSQWLALNALIATAALIIDRIWGEFLNQHHPVVYFGRFITGFEQHFYQDSVTRGVLLTLSAQIVFIALSLLILWALSYLPIGLEIFILSLIASTLLAHRMLHDSVLNVAKSQQPQAKVAMLVSRDTETMSDSDAYKAAIETYGENLSDGVIAPWLFLVLLGLPGMVIYKVTNTLDSMVGYRTQRYEHFGKNSALLDDVLNWIPARLSAWLILIIARKPSFIECYRNAVLHPSPNAGHPITAIAYHSQCRLGGPTVYFGELKPKAYFGRTDATKDITPAHIQQALQLRTPIDIALIGLSLLIFWSFI